MRKRFLIYLCLWLIVCSLSPLSLFAQQPAQPCQPPATLAGSSLPNIFTEEQESDLGDAVAEHVQREFRVLEDDEASAHLRRIGERLVRHLPPTKLRIQFFIVDIPEANAFVIPGGRIYVTRKLIAFVKSEDELAGVLGHEIGHLLAHDTAVEMTRRLREILGITQVTDRRDIFEKYNLLLDNVRRKPGATRRNENHEDKSQMTADMLGLYAVAAAGYNPQAQVEMWDRLTENKGNKGNWFSDLFGTTSPATRRFREMVKGIESLPAACKEARSPVSLQEFQKWQAVVLNSTVTGRKEALRGVLFKKQLEPPLRGDITHIRFSPDGKYLLAQDDAGINAFTREPFALLFRIEAPAASPAQFTPDSQNILFHNEDLRVQFWSVAEQKLKSAQEMILRRKSCLQTELSPDGKTLGCLDTSFDLQLLDVATGAVLFKKGKFHTPNFLQQFFLLLSVYLADGDLEDFEITWIKMDFSPDGRYFAAGSSGNVGMGFGGMYEESGSALAFDLTTRQPVQLRGPIKKLIATGFTFIAPDRIVGIHPTEREKSAIVTFPAGEIVKPLTLARGKKLDAPGHGNYILVRPVERFAVGIMKLDDEIISIGNKQSAIDVYDDVFAAERETGELGLYKVEGSVLQAKVTLPRKPFGRLRAVSLSPDFRWLAVSEKTRGAVWDVTSGKRVFHLRGFRGAHFAEDRAFYVDFPEKDFLARTIGILKPHQALAVNGPDFIGRSENRSSIKQSGPFVTIMRSAVEGGYLNKNVVLEVRDVRNLDKIWEMNFPKEPPYISVDAMDETMVLTWVVSESAAKAEIKNDPALAARFARMGEKEGDYLLHVMDARTGKLRGKLLIETGKGSFRIAQVFATGDWVVIVDTTNRVLVYSLATGEQKGKVFGNNATVSKTNGLLCVENESGQLFIYDLATMQKREQLTFSTPVALARFSDDGTRLFVLTATQTAYVLDVSTLSAASKLQ